MATTHRRRRSGKRFKVEVQDVPQSNRREWDDYYIYKDKHPDFDRMWAQHHRMVYKAAWIIGRERRMSSDQLIGTLVFKFNYTLHYWDPARGKLSTLFWSRIRPFLNNSFLRYESESADLSFRLRFRDDQDWREALAEYQYHEGGFNLYRCPERDDDWTAEIIGEFSTVKECWAFFCRDLRPRYKEVVEMYYGADMTLREIGNIMGVSKERIRQMLNKAIEHIRNRLAVVEKFVHLFPSGVLTDDHKTAH